MKFHWEHVNAFNAANVIAGIPAYALAHVSADHPSLHGHTDPVRQMDILGIPNLFDHTGNCIDGLMIANVAVAAGVALESVLGTQKSHPAAIAAGAAITASTVNVAYEAGVSTIMYDKPDGAPFDSGDALAGSLAGAAFAAVFCFAAIRGRRRVKRREVRQPQFSEEIAL